MATITALNVRLGMDASNFSQGAELARSEVNRVASVMRQSVPPAEKFKRDVDLLNKAFSESGRKTQEYANALEHLRRKYGQVDPAAKRATTSVDGLRMSMMSAVPGGHMLSGALRGPAGAMLAMAAAAAIAIRGMKQAAERIDETAKAARSLGFAYRDLVAIQMLASEVAGLDSTAVNRGLGQFVRRLAEARADGGKLKETMQALGLDVDKLASMAPADAFRAVSTAIAGIPDKAEQIRVATLLVGKEGVKMVELFRQGGAAVEAMAIEAERLGGVISDVSAAEIEAMNDAFGRSKMATEGIWNTLLSGVAPTFKNIARMAEEFFVLVRNGFTQTEKLVPVFSSIGFLINKMVDGFRAILAFVNDTMSLLGSVPGWIAGGELNMEFAEATRLLDEMDARSQGVKTATEQAAEAAEALAIETERAAEAAAKQEETFEKRVQDLQIESVALTGNIELAERMRLVADGYSETQVETLAAMMKQNEAIKERIKAEQEASKEAAKEAARVEKERERQEAEAIKVMADLEKSFELEVSAAMKAATDYFNAERQRDDDRRKAASQGPSSMEVGSAAAAKFMADQANQQLGAQAVPVRPTPGEKEIADKTQDLLLAQREANTKQQEELTTMKLLLSELKENGFRRVR